MDVRVAGLAMIVLVVLAGSLLRWAAQQVEPVDRTTWVVMTASLFWSFLFLVFSMHRGDVEPPEDDSGPG